MKKKLDKILIIDDSEADVFIMKRIINKAEVTNNIITAFGAQEALEYLSP